MKNLITIVSILTISISANAAVLQFKRGTESQVQASRLAAGEPAVATDSKKLFIGYSSAQGKVKQAYSPDATLLSRTNHTGSQAMSTITGLSTALAGKLDTTGGTLTGPIVVPEVQSSAADGTRYVRPYNSVPFSGTPQVGMIQATDAGPEWYDGAAWQSIGGGGGASSLAELSDWPTAVSATEVGYLDGVTAGIQGQIDGKAATGHTHASSAVTYDNTVSGMTATNVKTALDELKSTVTAQNSLITNLTTAMNNAGVDTTPPVLTRNAPVSASPAITTNSLVINYTTSDPQGMAAVTPLKYSINGAGAVAMTSGADSTLTGFTANVAIPVVVTASNAAGMTTTDTLSVTYQTPVAGVSPTSKTFADTNTGASSTAQNFTITNTGLANMTLSPGLSLTGADTGQFTLSKGTCTDGATIIPSGTCTASVTFSPTTSGAKTASLLVDSNAADVTASLSGTGTASLASYSDTFTGAISSNWVTLTGSTSIELQSGTYVAGSAVNQKNKVYYNATFSANQYSQITFVAPPNHSGVIVRATASGGYYALEKEDSSIYLKKCTTTNTCSDLTNVAYNVVNGDILRIEVVGNTLTGLVNGVQRITYTDSISPLSTGKAGLSLYSNTGNSDNWSGGDI